MVVLILLLVGFVIVVLFFLVKYICDMCDLLCEYRFEIKEFNVNVKMLKCWFNEIIVVWFEIGCNE